MISIFCFDFFFASNQFISLKLVQFQETIVPSAPPSVTLVKYREIVDILDGKGYLYQNISSNEAKKSKHSFQPIKTLKRIEINVDSHVPVTPLAPLKLKTEQKFKSSNLVDHYDYQQIEKCKESIPKIVPIKLDLEIGSQKLKDSFFWDKNDPIITPETFALIECEDFGLDPNDFRDLIADSIRQQIEKTEMQEPHPVIFDTIIDPILVIRLDIPIGYTRLTDAFEWDVRNPDENAPENFARKLCSEISLGGEFENAIAFSIRIQVLQYKKACEQYFINNSNSSVVSNVSNMNKNDQNTSESDQKPSEQVKFHKTLKLTEDPAILDTLLRKESDLNLFCPKLEALNEYELERKMKSMERSGRRSRRSTFNAALM
ncbi:MAG: SWI SNF, matrix associated, actin dependent regulator of chromatin, subfamily b, member 1 [Marteilia pararefringens]